MKLLSAVLLTFSSSMLIQFIMVGNLAYTSALFVAFVVAVYFFIDTFGPRPDSKITQAVSTTKSSVDAEFQAGPTKSAQDILKIARDQLNDPAAPKPGQEEAPIVFIEFAPLKKNESELRYFDEVTSRLSRDKRTLVIGYFHRHHTSAYTLADHLNYNQPLSNTICNEISENVDLIPYSGKIGPELAMRAGLFLDTQFKTYQRIVLILPHDQLAIWRGLVDDRSKPVHSTGITADSFFELHDSEQPRNDSNSRFNS